MNYCQYDSARLIVGVSMVGRRTTRLNPAQLARRTEIGGERRARMRKRLLDAAYRLFAIHGYDAPTIDDVVAEADVARGSFYNHFQTRDALFNAVADDIATDINSIIKPRLAGIADPAVRVTMALRIFVHLAVVHEPRGWILLRTMPLVGALNLEMKNYIHATFLEAVESGRFRAKSVAIVNDMALGLLLMTIRRVLTEKCGNDPVRDAGAAFLVAMGIQEAEARRIAYAPIDFEGITSESTKPG
jgi:AcrR family transcriptional regulator